MHKILRLSVSGAIGLIITAALFIGMLSLLNDIKPATSTASTDINFSFVDAMSEPQVEPKTKNPKPEQQIVKQPPAAPSIDIDTNNSPSVKFPPLGIEAKGLNLTKEFSIPGTGDVGEYGTDNPGVVKAAIAPMYPQQALISKTEGWVKVQISVNEFGTVSAVSIIDAEPARVFNAAAKKSVRKWKFHPKTINGEAVPFVATQTIEFKLDQ